MIQRFLFQRPTITDFLALNAIALLCSVAPLTCFALHIGGRL